MKQNLQPSKSVVPPNPCRLILEKEVFAHFGLTSEIEHIRFNDSHYTDALVAPLKGAPGLWIVFMWVERPFNFSSDAGYMEIISPEVCAKKPLNLTDPERIVHLSLRANRCPGHRPEDCQSGLRFSHMEPNMKCRMPNPVDSSSPSDYVVLSLLNFVMTRSYEEQAKERKALIRKKEASVPSSSLVTVQ